jgi:hypothetical protein
MTGMVHPAPAPGDPAAASAVIAAHAGLDGAALAARS